MTHQNIWKFVLLSWVLSLARSIIFVKGHNPLRNSMFSHNSPRISAFLKFSVELFLFKYFFTLFFVTFGNASGVNTLFSHVLNFYLVCRLHFWVGVRSCSRAVNSWNSELYRLSLGRRFRGLVMSFYRQSSLFFGVDSVLLVVMLSVVNNGFFNLCFNVTSDGHFFIENCQLISSCINNFLFRAQLIAVSLTTLALPCSHFFELLFCQHVSILHKCFEVFFSDFTPSIHVVFRIESTQIASIHPWVAHYEVCLGVQECYWVYLFHELYFTYQLFFAVPNLDEAFFISSYDQSLVGQSVAASYYTCYFRVLFEKLFLLFFGASFHNLCLF